MNIHFKSFLLTALLVPATCAFTACDDDKDMPASFSISDSTFNIAYDGLGNDGDRVMVGINSTGDWSMTKADEWLTLSQTQGSHGSYNLFIIAQENKTGKDRRGFIELEMGGKPQMLTVNQSRKTIVMTLSSPSEAVNAIGKTVDNIDPTVSITSNEAWTIKLPEGCDWIQPSVTEGQEGDTEVSFTVAANTTGAKRSAAVEFTSFDMTRKFTINQDWVAFSTDLTGDPTNISLGALDDEAKISFGLTCIEAWEVTEKPDWITISPDNGQTGTTQVAISATNNEDYGREGKITVTTAHGITLMVNITQRGTRTPFDDKPVGYAYFDDDMAWAVGGDDQVGSINGGSITTRNIYTWDFKGNGFHDVKAEFDKRYNDMNAKDKTVYSADGYLKFGAGKKQTAFQIKPALIEDNYKANIEVSFKAAKNGTDKIKFAVAIQGDGEIVDALNDEKTLSQLCDPINNTNTAIPWQWKEFKVTIKGATANTKIIIGESQFIIDGFNPRSGYFRGFIDDIAVKRIAND